MNKEQSDSNFGASLLDASCRMALAAYLHDLGKFAERARLEVDRDRLEIHEQQYARRNEAGGRTWYSHKHAAYTAMAWDFIERNFPELVGDDVRPFAAWNTPEVDDSIVNAAARHHKPETFLQWIVATADRVASGFEREKFEGYNAAEEKTATGKNHYTARELTLFEQISLQGGEARGRSDFKWRYPLAPLSVKNLFPVEAEGYEHNNNEQAQAEYQKLWENFIEHLQKIPDAHRNNWPLWMDHLDSAWACYTQAIPSATAFGARPEVSLYDHSRATAAIAVALWRYHHDRGDDEGEVLARMKDYSRPDWDEQKLLLIQGDFFGIQDFIFASGGETQRQAARLLRGRSFYVSLLTECAALQILEELSLPPGSQIINAAGKFLIVAPNTGATVERLRAVQKEMDGWFLRNCYGQSGIGIAWEPAACNDFLKGDKGGKESPFSRLVVRLFDRLDEAKARRFDLCASDAPPPLFDGFLESFGEHGVCAVDGRSPAKVLLQGSDGKYVSQLAADQISVGKQLAHKERLLITTAPINDDTLKLDIFGYRVSFTGGEEASGKFGALARDGSLRRAWDYSYPEQEGAPLFSGYARRDINGYVPLFGEVNAWDAVGRYKGISGEQEFDHDSRAPKTLEHIACEDRILEADDRWVGSRALTVLKGDVDNLGSIFQAGLKRPTFAKRAALSRQVNAFFAVYLPWLCASRYPSTYTVFAGGDDFYLIGPWRSTMQLALEMRSEFRRYVAGNSEIHFSAGMMMAKPGTPIRHLGEMAELALENAKRYGDGEKNAVTVFEQTVGWDEFVKLFELQDELERLTGDMDLSTGYIYGLQYFADMAQRIKDGKYAMDDALWNSRFTYRTRRMLERTRGLDEDACRRRQTELGEVIGGNISRYGSAFKIPLFTYLYQVRD